MNELVAIQALIAASQARVAAMNAANADRLNRGFSVAYDERSFWEQSEICEELYIQAMNTHVPSSGDIK